MCDFFGLGSEDCWIGRKRFRAANKRTIVVWGRAPSGTRHPQRVKRSISQPWTRKHESEELSSQFRVVSSKDFELAISSCHFDFSQNSATHFFFEIGRKLTEKMTAGKCNECFGRCP
jgi:hypothetical protein